MASPVEEPSKLNHRRRAVYSALSNVFAQRPTAVEACFLLWEREFAQQPHFVATRFVRLCADANSLDEPQRMQLTRRIFEQLAQPYEQLPPFPQTLLDASAAADAAPPARVEAVAAPEAAAVPVALPPAQAVSAAASITGAVGRSLLSPVRAQSRSNPGLVSAMLTDAFKHTKLDERSRSLALGWALQGGSDDAALTPFSDASLRQIVQALYLAACDALGPVAADKLLSQSIARAQALPAAVEYPPEQLL